METSEDINDELAFLCSGKKHRDTDDVNKTSEDISDELVTLTMKTDRKLAEEILENIHRQERSTALMEDSYVLKRVALRAMDKYFTERLKSLAPTDEEMVSACPQEYKPRLPAWMQGARWMRARFQPIGKTDKLPGEQGAPFDEEIK